MRRRYPSDLTDAQWLRIAPVFQQTRSRPRSIPARELINAIFYLLRNGCSWRAMPHDLPKWQTVFAQMRRWYRRGLVQQALARLASKPASVGIIDSTFIESAFGGGGSAPSGYKRARGHSVHVIIDKHRLPRALAVLPANRPDADGARVMAPGLARQHPGLHTILGDKAYRGQPLAEHLARHALRMDTTSPPLPKGMVFHPQPLRWRVEQFFAWFAKWRRVARNYCFTRAGYFCDVLWATLGLATRRNLTNA